MKTFWTTFYSYKGGVGRSLSLANIAALLVEQGRRVVLIDFDLEAPGLDSFEEFATASGKEGVVEYVCQFWKSKKAPAIEHFVHECTLPGPLRGKLWVMPAGKKDAAYNHHLGRINWSEMYESGLGHLFFENWKAAINSEFRPDFVFVDSRTGLTEVGGVCTTQFPDLVIMLFSLNEQNVRGTAMVANSIREANPDRIPQLHFVATPVPNLMPEHGARDDSKNTVSDRITASMQKLGTKDVSTIRYFPPAALSEKLFVLDAAVQRQAIIFDYGELLGKIVDFNRTGLDFLLGEVEKTVQSGDTARLERIQFVLDRDFADRAETEFARSRYYLLKGETNLAIAAAERSLNLDIAFEAPYNFLRGQYLRMGQLEMAAANFDRVLASSERLTKKRIVSIHEKRAEVLMALKQYAEAERSYEISAADKEMDDDDDASFTLVEKFNIAEARRRAERVIDSEEWRRVVKAFEEAGSASNVPQNTQANQWQAIHIAFACSGDIAAAKEALRKARRAAASVAEIEEIFSVKQYRYVGLSQFLAENDEMEIALENGRLWDGMVLATALP